MSNPEVNSPVELEAEAKTPVVNDTNTDNTSEEQTPTNEADSAPVVDEDESKVIPFKQYKSDLAKKNSEARNLRDRLKEVEIERDAFKEKYSELETNYNSTLEENRSIKLTNEVTSTARTLNARNPEKLIKLVDRNNITFKDNQIVGLEEELERIKQDFPELFNQTHNVVDGGAGLGQTPDASDMNSFLRKLATK